MYRINIKFPLTEVKLNSNSDRVSLSILHHLTWLKQAVNHPIEDVPCSMRRRRAGTGQDRTGGRDTVGLNKGTGVAVYCFMERVCLYLGVYTGGVESPHVGLVVYCRAGQEAHSWRILYCPPVSGATMTHQDCNDTPTNRSVIIHEHRHIWGNEEKCKSTSTIPT